MTEKKSRMERYSKLHDELLAEKEERIQTRELSPFAKQLNQIDSQFETMDIQTETDSNYQSPLHSRNDRYSLKKQVESGLNFEKPKEMTPENDEGFSNDYLDAFLNEAKQYNVDKGYRKDVDTKLNVLSSIDGWQSHLRPFGDLNYNKKAMTNDEKHIDTLPFEDELEVSQSVEEKLKTIDELQDDSDEDKVIEDNYEDDQQTIMMEVKRLSELEDTVDEDLHEDDETVAFVISDLENEENKSLQVEEISEEQVANNEEPTKSMSDRIINFFLYLLVFASFVVIVIIIYILLSINGVF